MKTHELPPWFPQDSIESLYSWQPGVSKVTPAGRIRTTDLPNRVKLAAQRKASCNICEQSLFSVWSWALRRACLFFPLFFGQTVDRNLHSTVGKRGCPRVPTHVRAARGRGHGKACLFFGVWLHCLLPWVTASQLGTAHSTQELGAIREFVRIGVLQRGD